MRRIDCQHDIHTLDTGFIRSEFAAAYLVIERGRAALIDCGSTHSRSALLAAMAARGIAPAAVDYLIVSHVHLDHAGGAGAMLAHLPNARLVVHPRGAPHMIDPSRLIAGATAVYGAERVAQDYGHVQPVPAERLIEAADGFQVDLAGRMLECLDAPGHARHHLVVWDARARAFFTGDCFGVAYPDLDGSAGPLAIPTTTPVQFEPEAMVATIGRMMARRPETMYLTHFGSIPADPAIAVGLLRLIEEMVAAAEASARSEGSSHDLRERLAALYLRRARECGVSGSDAAIRERLAVDIELNAQGLEVWRARSHARSTVAASHDRAGRLGRIVVPDGT